MTSPVHLLQSVLDHRIAHLQLERDGQPGELDDLLAARLGLIELVGERDRLNAIVNSPQSDDFLRAVSTEAEHQRQRWGTDHDGGKTPADWFWLLGYLAGKALHAHAADDQDKAEHHVITSAAACANWHRALRGQTAMRPGTDGQQDAGGS